MRVPNASEPNLGTGRHSNLAPVLGRLHQRGVALAVALILLILITLIGLAAIRGTTLQQRMTANFYDRQIAFQNAEAALRSAQAALAADSDPDDYRNCDGSTTGAEACTANPFADTALNTTHIKAVVAGSDTESGQYQASANAPGQPQYVIEAVCKTACTSAGNPDDCQSANCQSYGTQSGEQTVWYARVTARSGDPDTVVGANRAVVTLQALYAVPPPT